MSSYIVDDSTINTILAMLMYATKYKRNYPNPVYYDGLAIGTDIEAESLGQTLYMLNLEAVNQRYPDTVNDNKNIPGSIDENGDHKPYTYTHILTNGRMQSLKSLQCFIYQCSEGNVPQSKMYKALREYEFALCRDIVAALPEYDKANWA